MKTKLLTILLAAAATVSLTAQNFTYQNVNYTVLSSSARTVTTAVGSGNLDFPNLDASGELVLPEKVYNGATEYTLVEIGAFSFNGNENITSVVIPETVTKIGQSAFAKCRNMTDFKWHDNITTLGRNMFNGTHLTSITIPPKITEITDYAFSGMDYLTNIIVPDHVTKVGPAAFHSCNFARTIFIGEGVTEIAEDGFRGCSKAVSIVIGSNVKKIGNMAFENMKAAKVVSLNPTPPTVVPWSSGSYYAFTLEGDYTTDKSHILYVPKGSVDAYRKANGWKGFPNIMEYEPEEEPEPEEPIEPGLELTADHYVFIGIGESRDISPLFHSNSVEYCENTADRIATVTNQGVVTGAKFGEAVVGAYNIYGNLVATVGVFVCPTLSVVYPGSETTARAADASVTKHYVLHQSRADVVLLPSSRWQINSVTHDGVDVTDMVDVNTGRYLSAQPVTDNSVINVVAREVDNPTVGVGPAVAETPVRILVDGRTLTVTGAADDAAVTVVNVAGQVIATTTLKTVELPGPGVYVITVGESKFKAAVL